MLRIATALAGLAETGAVAFAVAMLGYEKNHGFTLADALVAPATFVLFTGPALLVLGMANRARTLGATLVAVALAVAFAGGLQGIRALPWHRGHWHDADASLSLFIAVFFAAWPLALIGMVVWRRFNRVPEAD